MNKFEYKNLTPFKWFVLENFPFIEADFDALTEWQLFCKIGKEMNKIINSENTLGTQIENVTNAFIDLQNYVNNYFDNLDVQDEINNKLNTMAESGELQEIINNYINLNAIIVYNNIEELKNATNLINASTVKTLGYYNFKDGGGAIYKITNNSENVDNLTKFAIQNNLYAELVFNGNIINAKVLGVHLDKKTIDNTTLQNAINLCKEKNYILKLDGYAYVTETIDLKGIKIIGVGTPAKAGARYNSKKYGNIGWDYLNNVNNGALITFTDYVDDYVNSGSGIISDLASPILKCNNKDGRLNLENICVCGWLRKENQIGIKTTFESDVNYIFGQHNINNCSIINCGGNALELENLEQAKFFENEILYNGGNGVYIKGINGVDTPSEYTNFFDNTIEGNFKNGVVIENSFNKLINFTENNFSRNGLYKQRSIIPPTDNTVFSGVLIKDRKSTVATQQNLIFTDNYGEEIQTLLNIVITNEGHNIFNNITLQNNIIYPLNANSYMFYITGVSYANGVEINKNYTNGGKVIQQSINNLGYVQTEIQHLTPTINTNLNVKSFICLKQGQKIHLELFAVTTEELPQYTRILENMPKNITEKNLDYYLFTKNVNTGAYLKTVPFVMGANGNLGVQETIPNNTFISIVLDYYCYSNVL